MNHPLRASHRSTPTALVRLFRRADGVCNLFPDLIAIELQVSVGIVHLRRDGNITLDRTVLAFATGMLARAHLISAGIALLIPRAGFGLPSDSDFDGPTGLAARAADQKRDDVLPSVVRIYLTGGTALRWHPDVWLIARRDTTTNVWPLSGEPANSTPVRVLSL
jgi:hypothetical protein